MHSYYEVATLPLEVINFRYSVTDTKNIRALQYSRPRQSQCAQNTSMLIVTMPTTPGESSLSGVMAEVDGIKRSFWDYKVVAVERPTAEGVLQGLPCYDIAHFACHGVSQTNPADSHLLLLKQSISHEGLTTEKVDKLRVKNIEALNLPAAQLAYLSACSTVDNTSSELADRVAHIVSSFHIAGFVHVIGTLWPSQDWLVRRWQLSSIPRSVKQMMWQYLTVL